jgi:hypothetical protein
VIALAKERREPAGLVFFAAELSAERAAPAIKKTQAMLTTSGFIAFTARCIMVVVRLMQDSQLARITGSGPGLAITGAAEVPVRITFPTGNKYIPVGKVSAKPRAAFASTRTSSELPDSASAYPYERCIETLWF